MRRRSEIENSKTLENGQIPRERRGLKTFREPLENTPELNAQSPVGGWCSGVLCQTAGEVSKRCAGFKTFRGRAAMAPFQATDMAQGHKEETE